MIPGVAGWVSVTLPPLGRATVTVNGMLAQRLNGGDWLLPGVTGTPILVKLRRGVADPFPRILTVDATYLTGPALSGGLKALLLLPVVLLPFAGVVLGALFALPAFIANMSVSRSALSTAGKGAAMAAIDLGAVLGVVGVIGGLYALMSLAG